MELHVHEVVRLLLALVVGGLIGAEREYRDKSAGFRTMIFICFGATLFTMLSGVLGGEEDPVRIAASIVSGIGFLGAGSILRSGNRTRGLTTAATIWLTAALGMALGSGHYALVGVGTSSVLLVLWFFPRLEHYIDNIREARTYRLTLPISADLFEELEGCFRDEGLEVRSHGQAKEDERMTCTWDAYGKPAHHEALTRKLLLDGRVERLEF